MPSHDDGDIRLRVGFKGHFKTRLLHRRLGGDGVLGLIWIWLFARTARLDGDLSGMTDDAIETVAEWTGERGALVAALVSIAWLDGDAGARRIHEWREHQPWVTEIASKRSAGRSGGLRSAEVRAARYGSAQPKQPRSNPEAVLRESPNGASGAPKPAPAPPPAPPPTRASSLPSRTSDACARERATPVRGVVALPDGAIDFDRRRRAAEALRANLQADARAKAAANPTP